MKGGLAIFRLVVGPLVKLPGFKIGSCVLGMGIVVGCSSVGCA